MIRVICGRVVFEDELEDYLEEERTARYEKRARRQLIWNPEDGFPEELGNEEPEQEPEV